MGKYVERNLNLKEEVLRNAELHPLQLILAWIWGVLGCWLLLIPTIKAIKATVMFCNTELAITDKRVIGKVGFIKSASLDTPLNKIQAVTVNSGFWGKIFNYGTVSIQSGGNALEFVAVKDADGFKKFLMNQIDEYENDKIKAQAQQMAAAMTAGNN